MGHQGALLKRFIAALAGTLLIVTGLGLYFLVELYRPFEPRVTAPKNLVPQYTGPGALPQEPAQAESSL